MAKKARPVHTVPNPSGSGWVSKQGGNVVSAHRRKDTAQAAGRQQAISSATEHRIHNLNGQIRQANSYGGDPNPPRDKNH